MLNYRPAPCRVDALLVRVKGRRLDAPHLGWSCTLTGSLELVDIPFEPLGALAEGNARRLAVLLADRLGLL